MQNVATSKGTASAINGRLASAMDCSVRGQSTTKAPSTRHPAVSAKPMNCRWRLANTECPHMLQDIGERHDTRRRLKARTVLYLLRKAPQPRSVESPRRDIGPPTILHRS